MKNGFTLVELSIVLIIIGLLTGGILIGQSLIQTAGNNSFISYASQLDTAVVQFQDRYGCLPGDCSKLGGVGNDSGFIGSVCAIIPGAAPGDCWSGSGYMNPEAKDFWVQLSLFGFQPDGRVYDNSFTGYNDAKLGVNIPELDMLNDDGTVKLNRFLPTEGYPGFGWAARNNYSFVSLRSKQHNFWQVKGFGGLVNPANLLAIDRKIDDGHPIIGHTMLEPTATDIYGACATTNNLGQTTYNIDNEEPACSVNMAIGFTIDPSNILPDNRISHYGYTP